MFELSDVRNGKNYVFWYTMPVKQCVLVRQLNQILVKGFPVDEHFQYCGKFVGACDE